MNATLRILMLGLILVFAANVQASPEETLRKADGSSWRGEINDHVEITFVENGVEIDMEGTLISVSDRFIKVKGTIGGTDREKIIFVRDIVEMESVESGGIASEASVSESGDAGTDAASQPADAGDDELGVFLLPLKGGVGTEIRHDEIEELGRYIDEHYGPGQIIVITIHSNGGLVLESEMINETIKEIRERHRVVAWIEKAISAGCSTAMACTEIYFQTSGTAGSVTTVRGQTSVSEAEVMPAVERFAKMAEDNGYSQHIARSMKLNRFMCSYDKDEETGEVTFHGDMSGEFTLSTANQNLCFNASNALHCGFSKGTANTEEELAALLDLPKWHEKDDYGRKLSEKWQKTCKTAAREIPVLIAQMNYKGAGTGDISVIIGNRIRIYEKLIQWVRRAPVLAYYTYGIPPVEDLQQEIKNLRRLLSRSRR